MPLVKWAGTTIHNPGRIAFFRPETQVTLNSLVAQYGFPLYGLWIAPDSIEIPDFIKHISAFPPQTGAPSQRADKLQTALDSEMQAIYAAASEESYGARGRPFFTNTHFWNYRDNPLDYRPRDPSTGTGDFAFLVSVSSPPGNWWHER